MSSCIQPDPGEVLSNNKNSTSMHNRREVKKKTSNMQNNREGEKAKPHDLDFKQNNGACFYRCTAFKWRLI